MKNRLFAPISIIALVSCTSHAAIVIDDDFNDSSTAGWTENLFGGTGSIVESGSSVVLTSTRGVGGGGPMVMSNNTLLNSSGSIPTTITVAVDSLSGSDPDGRFLFGLLDDGFAGFLVLNAGMTPGGLRLQIEAGTPGGGGGPTSQRLIPLTTIPYTLGSPLLFTMSFDSDSLSVTEGGGYSSGDLSYASSFEDGNGTPIPGYNPLVLLSADSNLALVSNTETDQSDFVTSIGRITVDGGAAPVPEPSTAALLGGLALLGLVRKRVH